MMTNRNGTLTFYSCQSPFSDPGKYLSLFDELPASLEELCAVVHGLVLNPCDSEKLYGYTIPEKRLAEANLHYLEDILQVIIDLDPSPLTHNRPPEKRLVGYCRDFALLLASILRSRGIPVRLRCGFETYYKDPTALDHWICEFWNEPEGRWLFVDPELGPEEIKAGNLQASALHIPEGEYLPAGKVWQLCRSGQADPGFFGAPVPGVSGWWFIRAEILRDIAALNKVELVPWDYTEFADKQFKDLSELSADEINLFDRLANLSATATNENFSTFRQIYQENAQVRVGDKVASYVGEKPVTTVLR